MTSNETVAVGIVSYNDAAILQQCIDAVLATVGPQIPVVVYDDASWSANARLARQRPEAGEWLRTPDGYETPRLTIIENRINRGSAYGRTQLWRWAEESGYDRMATIDMDIRVHEHWLSTLLNVMDRHANCGIATYTYANDHGGHFPVVADGQDLRVAETASMCWLVRIAMLNDCLGPDLVWGMDPRMEVFSHDSEFSQRMRRGSDWRMFLSAEPLISEFVQHHSSRSNSPTLKAVADARRDKDFKVWAELEASRGWDKDKTDP